MTFNAADFLADAPDPSIAGTVASGTASWDNTDAVNDPTEAIDGAGTWAQTNVVWHKLFIPEPGACTFQDLPDADSTDTYMVVYSGGPGVTSFADLTYVATGDDEAGDNKPLINYESPGGEWLYIAHTCYVGARSGPQSMQWSVPAAVPSPDTLALAALDPDVLGAAVYDTDGTFLAVLPLAAGVQFQREVSAPGAISFKLPLSDTATSLVTARRIVKVFWRGAAQQAARIAGSRTDVAVDGTIWREWSNLPGLLSCLATVPILPEYGLDRATGSQRTFGYMARDGHGEWLSSGNFTAAIGIDWLSMTGPRAGLPEAGLDAPNPQWIAKNGPDFDEPANQYQYPRRVFSTTDRQKIQILTTFDNTGDLWLDGEQIVSSDAQNPFTWRQAIQVLRTLPAGQHTLAARVRNGRDGAVGVANHMGFLFTMSAVDTSGNVVGSPIINSDTGWIISDITPGFRHADVLFREWVESSSYGYTDVDLLTLGFTRTHDSSGVAWADDPAEYTVDVASPVLDLISTFTEKDADVLVDPTTLRLRMWNRLGSDLSATVHLRTGRDGGGLIAHPVERVEPVFNTVLLQLADGRWLQRQNAAQVAAEGRHGTGLAAGGTTDAASGGHLADAQIADAALPVVTFAARVSTLVGPQPCVDFGLGDTVTVPDENGTGTYKARVMAITGDASTDGPVQITLDLMLDRSGTSTTLSSGGAGTTDPGDLEAT